MASRFDRAEEGCELGTVVGLVRAPTEIGRIPAAVWVVEKEQLQAQIACSTSTTASAQRGRRRSNRGCRMRRRDEHYVDDSTDSPRRRAAWSVLGARIAGAVFGGYVVTALAVAAAGALLMRLGLARAEAVVLAAMLGFLGYLVILLWGFSVARVARLWAGLVAAAGAFAGLLWWMQA